MTPQEEVHAMGQGSARDSVLEARAVSQGAARGLQEEVHAMGQGGAHNVQLQTCGVRNPVREKARKVRTPHMALRRESTRRDRPAFTIQYWKLTRVVRAPHMPTAPRK